MMNFCESTAWVNVMVCPSFYLPAVIESSVAMSINRMVSAGAGFSHGV